MIITRTPLRISFFGGGTDYPAWYVKHGGAVLSTTINKYCWITCRYLPPFFEHKFRIVYSRNEYCHKIEDIQHPAVRAVLGQLRIERGLEVHHDGDLPARSGMGTSSAFTVGLLHALHALYGRMPSKRQLTDEGIHIEQEVLKETVGSQDQVSAAHGGFNHIAFAPNKEITVRPMTLSADRVEELQSHLMLFYTGLVRTASDVASTYVEQIDKREFLLLRMKSMVDVGVSILESGMEMSAFGDLLDEAWQLKRSLSSSVSNEKIEEIYADAKAAGARGGKITGAGGGGFMLLFVNPADQQKVRARLGNLLHIPFKMEWHGSQVIFFEPEEDFSASEKERDSREIAAFRENVVMARSKKD